MCAQPQLSYHREVRTALMGTQEKAHLGRSVREESAYLIAPNANHMALSFEDKNSQGSEHNMGSE